MQINSFGQSINETDLIGKWKVVNIIESKDMPTPKTAEEKKMLESLKTAFLNSTFEFKSDYNFNLNIDFEIIGKMMKKVHWKLDSKKMSVIIQNWKDSKSSKFKLMEIFILNKNGKTYFSLRETPLLLEVKK